MRSLIQSRRVRTPGKCSRRQMIDGSVMVSRLKEFNASFLHCVYEPMFLIDPA